MARPASARADAASPPGSPRRGAEEGSATASASAFRAVPSSSRRSGSLDGRGPSKAVAGVAAAAAAPSCPRPAARDDDVGPSADTEHRGVGRPKGPSTKYAGLQPRASSRRARSKSAPPASTSEVAASASASTRQSDTRKTSSKALTRPASASSQAKAGGRKTPSNSKRPPSAPLLRPRKHESNGRARAPSLPSSRQGQRSASLPPLPLPIHGQPFVQPPPAGNATSFRPIQTETAPAPTSVPWHSAPVAVAAPTPVRAGKRSAAIQSNLTPVFPTIPSGLSITPSPHPSCQSQSNQTAAAAQPNDGRRSKRQRQAELTPCKGVYDGSFGAALSAAGRALVKTGQYLIEMASMPGAGVSAFANSVLATSRQMCLPYRGMIVERAADPEVGFVFRKEGCRGQCVDGSPRCDVCAAAQNNSRLYIQRAHDPNPERAHPGTNISAITADKEKARIEIERLRAELRKLKRKNARKSLDKDLKKEWQVPVQKRAL